MPFYLRKRIKIAPGLALNVSKSGLGLSVGPKGFKVSHGPRGTQINAGRGGLYYRKSVNGKGRRSKAQATQPIQLAVSVPQPPHAPIGQLNGVVADRRQPTTGQWPNKSRPPVFAVGSVPFWLVLAACVLVMAFMAAAS